MSKIRRYEELMESAIANFIAGQEEITDINEGGVIHTTLDTFSRLLERSYVAIRQGYNELLAIMPYLIFGIEKKNGNKSSGTVVFSRISPLTKTSIIPKGTQISGAGLNYYTTETGSILPNMIESDEIPVIAEDSGLTYNIKAGIIKTIDSIVPADVVTVTNNMGFTNGCDEETEAEFEARFKAFINGLSGTNTYAIRAAALDVDGVRSVSALNHKPPLKNIYNMSIYVDDGSGGAADEIISQVKLAIAGDGKDIKGHLAPGVNIRVLAPTALPVNINALVTVYDISDDEAKTRVIDTISEYINSLPIGKAVKLSIITQKVMALSFVKDFKILSPDANIEPSIAQIARTGILNISIGENA